MVSRDSELNCMVYLKSKSVVFMMNPDKIMDVDLLHGLEVHSKYGDSSRLFRFLYLNAII